MSRVLPVPIAFELPDGWRSVPPAEVGSPDTAFVALHPGSRDGFTATITVDGDTRGDGADLAVLADESANRLAERAVAVKVGRREQSGTAMAGSLTQALGMRVRIGTGVTDLAQLQTYLALADLAGSGRRAVLTAVLTATPRQLTELMADFQEFLASIRPDRPTGPPPSQTPPPQTPQPPQMQPRPSQPPSQPRPPMLPPPGPAAPAPPMPPPAPGPSGGYVGRHRRDR